MEDNIYLNSTSIKAIAAYKNNYSKIITKSAYTKFDSLL